MLDVDQRALGLGALGDRAAGVAGQDRVLGVVLHAAGVVGVAMRVHGRADHDRQVQHQRALAEDDLAVLIGELLVPAVRQVDRGRGHTGAVVVVLGVGVQLALILAFGQVVRVGAAGAVVRGHLRQADRLHAADGVEGVRGEVEVLLQRDLVDEFRPTLVVEVGALHVVDGQGAGGVAEDDVGGVLVGFQFDEVVAEQFGDASGCGQSLVGGRECAVPVGAGQVGHRAGFERVVVHRVVALGQLVGDLGAVVAHGEGVGIHVALPGPLVGLGGVAGGGHAVGFGVTLGGKHVVERVVRVGADGEVVVARIHDVGLRAVGVIAGQVRHVHVDGDGLGFARFQQAGLLVVHQLDGGLLHAVLTIVLGVRGGGVQLDDGLAGHVARVGHGHGGGGGLLVAGHLHRVERLVERGVAQAVAERVHDLVGVVPRAVRGGHGAVGVRIGAGRGLLTTVAHHDVRIPGLVVPVAGIDALGFDEIGVHGRVLGEVGRIRPRDVAVVLHGRGHGAVLGEQVTERAGGVDGAVERIGHAVEAVGARVADPHDRVDVRILLQIGDLHRVDGVDEHDDGVEVGLGLLDQRHLLVGQAQDIAGHGVHAVGQTGLARIVAVAVLAGRTADHYDGRVVVLAVLRGVVGVELGQLVQRQLARIVVLGDIRILGDDAAAELRGRPLLVREVGLVRGQHRGVELEALLGERVRDLNGRVAVGDRAAGAAVDRRVAAHAEHRDLRVLGDRQRVVLVLQQDVGLLALLERELLETVVRLLGRLEFRLVGPGVLVVVRGLGDGLLAACTEEGIDRGAVHLQRQACDDGDGQQQRAHRRQPSPDVCSFEHLSSLILWSGRIPSATTGRRSGEIRRDSLCSRIRGERRIFNARCATSGFSASNGMSSARIRWRTQRRQSRLSGMSAVSRNTPPSASMAIVPP